MQHSGLQVFPSDDLNCVGFTDMKPEIIEVEVKGSTYFTDCGKVTISITDLKQ